MKKNYTCHAGQFHEAGCNCPKCKEKLRDELCNQKDKIQRLIIDEMAVALKEGTATSRLTSLSNKIAIMDIEKL